MLRKLLDGLLKGGNSSTVRLGGLFAIIWGAVSQSEFFLDVIAKNPDWAAVIAGIQGLIMIVQRYRTKEAVEDKPRLFIDKPLKKAA